MGRNTRQSGLMSGVTAELGKWRGPPAQLTGVGRAVPAREVNGGWLGGRTTWSRSRKEFLLQNWGFACCGTDAGVTQTDLRSGSSEGGMRMGSRDQDGEQWRVSTCPASPLLPTLGS